APDRERVEDAAGSREREVAPPAPADPTPSSPELDLVPAAEAMCEVTLAQAKAAAEETLRLANVELAAQELRRLHVLARAKARVEQLLAEWVGLEPAARKRAPVETVWDQLLARPVQACRG